MTQSTFRTPRGTYVSLWHRPDTNDADVLRSCLDEDEYRLKELRLEGWAFDIGAHIGAVTVALLVDNPELRVLALEPIPENVEMIQRNVESARVQDRCAILLGAIGTKAIAWNWRGDKEALKHRWIGNQHFSPGTTHDVLKPKPYSLSDLMLCVDGPVSFLKADCEGCEDDLLADPAAQRIPLIRGEKHQGPVVGPFEVRA